MQTLLNHSTLIIDLFNHNTEIISDHQFHYSRKVHYILITPPAQWNKERINQNLL